MAAVNKSRLIGFRLSVLTRSLRYLPSKPAPHPLLIFSGEHTRPSRAWGSHRPGSKSCRGQGGNPPAEPWASNEPQILQ